MDAIRSQIRQRLTLDGRPEVFYRVQLGSITGKPDDFQPIGVGRQVVLNLGTVMGGQTIPKQNDPTRNLPMQCLQIADNRVFLDRFGLQMQHDIGQTAIRLTDQTAYSVEAFPVKVMCQLRCLSTRCPGASNAGFEGESALVEESELGPSLDSPFFLSGNSSSTK